MVTSILEDQAAAPVQPEPSRRAPYIPPSERADRSWRRSLLGGLLAAVLLHLAILFSVRSTPVPISPFAAAGPAQGDVSAAAGGGGGMEAIEFRVRQPQAEPQPQPTPLPVPEPPIIEIEAEPEPELPPDADPEITLALPGVGTGTAAGAKGASMGPGTAEGRGEGGGGTEEEGGSGIVAPVPRGMILPPSDRPRGVRGTEITVWVFVTPQGRVVPDSTRIDPPTSDRKYNRRLKETAAEWVFDPARKSGRTVAAWYPYQIIL